MLLVNLQMLATAGVFATTINYLWPLATFSFVVAVTLNPFANTLLRRISYVVIVPAMIFAVCSEQIAVLGVLLTSGYIAYMYYHGTRVPPMVWVLLILAIGGVLNVLLSPGNDVRTGVEIQNWWPEFEQVSLIDKLIIGSIATFSRLFLAPELPAVLFVFLLATIAFLKRNLWAFISILPALITVVLFFFPQTAGQPGTYIVQVNYLNELQHFALNLSPHNLPSPDMTKVYVLIFSLITLSIVVSIYFLYGATKKTYVLLLMLTSGLAVSVAVSLSPTVFASTTRTLYPFVTILVGVNFVVAQDIIRYHFSPRTNLKKD